MLAVGSCDRQITQPVQNDKDAVKDYSRFIPSSGSSALPGSPQNRFRKGSAASSTSSTPDSTTIDLIHNFLDSQDTYHYAAIAGVWNRETQEYEYQLIPLSFPDSVLQQAGGQTTTYTYQLTNPDNGVLRKLTSVVPAAQTSKKLMSNWLKVKTSSNVKTDSSQIKSNAAPDPVMNVIDVSTPCPEGPDLGICWRGDEWYVCEEWTVCADAPGDGTDGGNGGGGGGGDYSDWPPPAGGPTDDGSDDQGAGGCPTCSSGPGSGDDGSDDHPVLRYDNAAEKQLKLLLRLNDFALLDIPCSEIPNWQALAQFTPPQSVIDKIANLDDNYTSIITGDWNIQYIQDASGAVINNDYFPVTVNQLPDNPATGQPFTADGFLDYIRTNLDDFMDGNSTEFGPYNNAENQIWQSDNYLGAIMRFEITPMVGLSQDGSVISSDQSGQSWNFTTIESPADWNHPVSGTRKFGYTQNGDDSYTFYTRGVDRIAESTDEFIGNYTPATGAFEGADALWNTFKDDVYGFIENHGGNAQQPADTDNSTWRPNWDEVNDIMMNTGSRTVSDLGCK